MYITIGVYISIYIYPYMCVCVCVRYRCGYGCKCAFVCCTPSSVAAKGRVSYPWPVPGIPPLVADGQGSEFQQFRTKTYQIYRSISPHLTSPHLTSSLSVSLSLSLSLSRLSLTHITSSHIHCIYIQYRYMQYRTVHPQEEKTPTSRMAKFQLASSTWWIAQSW